MATITDFNVWLHGIEADDHNDIYCLYNATRNLEEWGPFNCYERVTSSGSMYFVKCTYIDGVLMLASEKAKNFFLDTIEKKYADEGMSIEAWYGYKNALEKND